MIGRGRVSLCPKQSLTTIWDEQKVKAEMIQGADAELAKGETSGFLLAVQPLEASFIDAVGLFVELCIGQLSCQIRE